MNICDHEKFKLFCEQCLIASLNKEIIQLRNRVEGLHQNKLKQIDENKKMYDRMDEIISLFIKQDNKLENYIIELDLKIEKLEKNYIHKIAQICPVCDGCGNNKGERELNPNYGFCMKYASCNSCEGKGIVWG